LQVTHTVPIIFPVAGDPVGAGLVDSLAHPGGNVTGFMTVEYSFAGKWLELLKQVAPGVTRAAVLRDASQGSGTGQFAVIQAMAPSLGVEVTPVNVRDTSEIEHAVATFARDRDDGRGRSGSSPFDRHIGDAVPIAGSVQWTPFHQPWRPDVL